MITSKYKCLDVVSVGFMSWQEASECLTILTFSTKSRVAWYMFEKSRYRKRRASKNLRMKAQLAHARVVSTAKRLRGRSEATVTSEAGGGSCPVCVLLVTILRVRR